MSVIIWIKKNWLLIATLVVIAVLVSYIKYYGEVKYNQGVKTATAVMQAKMDKLVTEQATKMTEASKGYQETKAEQAVEERIQYVTIQKIIEKPVYIRDCLDDDGLHEVNRAITSK